MTIDNTTTLIYKTFNFTQILEGQFATHDAIANVTSQIVSMGLYYRVDWELSEVNYDKNGEQCLHLEFKDDKRAMMVKIKGLNSIHGQVI